MKKGCQSATSKQEKLSVDKITSVVSWCVSGAAASVLGAGLRLDTAFVRLHTLLGSTSPQR